MTEKAYFHLPGLFEAVEFYRVFLPLFFCHREYFFDRAEIGSLYGAPEGCLWGGGRIGAGEARTEEILTLCQEYGISARLTFSNSLLQKEHLSDAKCNRLCAAFEARGAGQNGVIVHSDLLLSYLRETYPGLYFVSSTTKVLTDFSDLAAELSREEFRYVVPDFRLNRRFPELSSLSEREKDKVEFLCNECCDFGCRARKACYENVSRRMLGEPCGEFLCRAPGGAEGYRFSKAMENPGFISAGDITDCYLPLGFTNFKLEGRGLGTAILLEFLLYYLTKPEYRLRVREEIYLDSMLDLF